jgi:hypothetical protein
MGPSGESFMTESWVPRLYEDYLDTIGRCTSELRQQSDEEIEYQLFEQFDGGAWSFLHEDNLIKLRDAGYIDDEMVAMSKQVRERWLALQKKSWTTAEIRTRREWQELFELCDRLRLRSLKRPRET